MEILQIKALMWSAGLGSRLIFKRLRLQEAKNTRLRLLTFFPQAAPAPALAPGIFSIGSGSKWPKNSSGSWLLVKFGKKTGKLKLQKSKIIVYLTYYFTFFWSLLEDNP